MPARELRPKVGAWLHELFKEKRTYMLLSRLGGVGRALEPSGGEPGFRVPPDEYREVLGQFIREIRAVGATPLLITAPRRNINGIKEKYPEANDKVDFVAVHDHYADLTREVAEKLDVELLDLHRIFEGEEFDGYFLSDGIHFTQDGLRVIARQLHAWLKDLAAPDTESASFRTSLSPPTVYTD